MGNLEWAQNAADQQRCGRHDELVKWNTHDDPVKGECSAPRLQSLSAASSVSSLSSSMSIPDSLPTRLTLQRPPNRRPRQDHWKPRQARCKGSCKIHWWTPKRRHWRIEPRSLSCKSSCKTSVFALPSRLL